MPPRSIKVVEMNPQVEEPTHEDEAVQSEQEQEQVQAEEPSDQCDVDSDDLAVLVKEYANERRHKLKESAPKVVCQYCDKESLLNPSSTHIRRIAKKTQSINHHHHHHQHQNQL